MESLVSSDVARLVYGYLEEQNCSEAAQCFLETSVNLKECREVVKKGRRFYTKIAGRGLSEMLDTFSEIIYLVSLVFSESSNDQLTPVQLFSKIAALVGYSENAITKKVFDATPAITSTLSLLDGADTNNSYNEVLDSPPVFRTPPSSTKKKSAHPQKSPRDSHKLTQEDIFDLNVLDSLINNTVLHEKIAENINKAKENDSCNGEGNVIVKAALSNTEADPIFDEVINEIVGSTPAINAVSSTLDDTEAEIGGESQKTEEDNNGSEEGSKKGTTTEFHNLPTLVPGTSPIIIQVVPSTDVSGLPQASFLNFHGLMQTQKPESTSTNVVAEDTREVNRYRPILPKPSEDEIDEPVTPIPFSPLKIPLRRSIRMRGGRRKRGSKRNLQAVRPTLERINKDNYHIDFATPPAIAAVALKRKRGRPPKQPHVTHEMIRADLLERARRLREFGNLNPEEILSHPLEEIPKRHEEVSVITIIAPSDEVPCTSNELNQVLKDVLEESSDDDSTKKKNVAALNEDLNEKGSVKICMNDFNLSDDSNGADNCGLIIEEEPLEQGIDGEGHVSQEAIIANNSPEEKGNIERNDTNISNEEDNETTTKNNHNSNTTPDKSTECQEQTISDQVPIDSSKCVPEKNSCKDNVVMLNVDDKHSNEAELVKLAEEKDCSKEKPPVGKVLPEITPRVSSRALGRKGLSLSSPRKGSHVRALDFKTPDKSICPRKAVTSPKAVSQVNLSKLRSMRRVSLFKSPQKKKVGSSWDADLRLFCPSTDSSTYTKKPKATDKPKRPYVRRTPLKNRQKKTIPRKRGTELNKASKEAEKRVLSIIEEETYEKTDELIKKIFINPSTSSDKQSSQFAVPKSPGPVLKTPAKPLLPGLKQSSLTPTLMTPVSKILKEHANLLETSQLITPSFTATPDCNKLNGESSQQNERTPSPQPSEKRSELIESQSKDPTSTSPVEQKDQTFTDLSTDSSLAETDKSSSVSPISSALKKKGKSNFPLVSLPRKKKKPLKKPSLKESLIEQCLEQAKNELFPSSAKKKQKGKALINSQKERIIKQIKMPTNSIELPSLDKIMELDDSSSSSEEVDSSKPASNCLSKHYDISFTNSSSDENDLCINESMSSSIDKPTKDRTKHDKMAKSPNESCAQDQTAKSVKKKTPDKSAQKQNSVFFKDDNTQLHSLISDISSNSSDIEFFATQFFNSTEEKKTLKGSTPKEKHSPSVPQENTFKSVNDPKKYNNVTCNSESAHREHTLKENQASQNISPTGNRPSNKNITCENKKENSSVNNILPNKRNTLLGKNCSENTSISSKDAVDSRELLSCQNSSGMDETKQSKTSSKNSKFLEGDLNKSNKEKSFNRKFQDGISNPLSEENKAQYAVADTNFPSQRMGHRTHQKSSKHSPGQTKSSSKSYEDTKKHEYKRDAEKFADSKYHVSERMEQDAYSKYEERRDTGNKYYWNVDSHKKVREKYPDRKYNSRDRRREYYSRRHETRRMKKKNSHYNRIPSSKYPLKGYYSPERYKQRPTFPTRSPVRRYPPRRSPHRHPPLNSPHCSPSKSPRRHSSSNSAHENPPLRSTPPRSPRRYSPPKSSHEYSPIMSPEKHIPPLGHEHSSRRHSPPRSPCRYSPLSSPHEYSPPRSPDLMHQRSPPKSPQSPSRPSPPRSPSVCPPPKSPPPPSSPRSTYCRSPHRHPVQDTPPKSPRRHSSPRCLDAPYSPPRNVSPIFSPYHQHSHHYRGQKSTSKSDEKKKIQLDPSLQQGSFEAKDICRTKESHFSTPTSTLQKCDSATDPRLIDPRFKDPRMAGRSSIYKNLSSKQPLSPSEKGRSAKRKLGTFEKEDGEITDSDNSCQTYCQKKQKIDFACTNTQSSDVNSSFASVDQVSSEKGKSLLEKVGVDRFLSILHGSP